MALRRVGILGGTFDPVHYGHLTAAVGSLHYGRLDQVIFVPSGKPPHKGHRPITAPQHRLAMVELAVADEPALAVSRIEMERPGPHYTVDTLELLAQAHPDWELHFITGLDGFLGIETWRDYQRLLRRWPFLVVSRPGHSRRQWQALVRRLDSDLMTRIQFHQIPGQAISGEQMRQLAAEGYPLRYLTPPAVLQYIHEHRLYVQEPGAGSHGSGRPAPGINGGR